MYRFISNAACDVGSRLHTNYWNDVYRFFKVHGKAIPTTIIAGNHDQIKNGSRETLLEGFDQLVEVVVSPMRVTPELVKILRAHQPVYLMTHFNHPRELTAQAKQALDLVVDS